MQRSAHAEIRTDRDIDLALAFLFLVLVSISIYNIIKADSDLFRIEVAGSIPLNFLAAISFLIRDPAIETTRRDEVAIPAISFFLPLLAMNSPIIIDAPYSLPFGLIVAILGASLGIVSFIFLRRSFAILPSVRKVVSGGPYRMIRHPLYLGEFFYSLGMVMLSFSILSLALILSSAVFLVWRIEIEEHKLTKYPAYRDYAQRVKYRLLPYIY
jgi:protein-S-isoprenylcysteine O-methyltransferase Ste14